MRWLGAGVFAAMVHDLRVLLRDFAGRKKHPTAAILDSRTLQSTPESGARSGYEAKRCPASTPVRQRRPVEEERVNGSSSPVKERRWDNNPSG
jgi:hypothetical protein